MEDGEIRKQIKRFTYTFLNKLLNLLTSVPHTNENGIESFKIDNTTPMNVNLKYLKMMALKI